MRTEGGGDERVGREGKGEEGRERDRRRGREDGSGMLYCILSLCLFVRRYLSCVHFDVPVSFPFWLHAFSAREWKGD